MHHMIRALCKIINKLDSMITVKFGSILFLHGPSSFLIIISKIVGRKMELAQFEINVIIIACVLIAVCLTLFFILSESIVHKVVSSNI